MYDDEKNEYSDPKVISVCCVFCDIADSCGTHSVQSSCHHCMVIKFKIRDIDLFSVFRIKFDHELSSAYPSDGCSVSSLIQKLTSAFDS